MHTVIEGQRNETLAVARVAGAALAGEPATVRLLPIGAVESKTGYRKSSLYAWVRDGKFPAPYPLSDRKNVWLESEVDAWIESRIAAASAIRAAANAIRSALPGQGS